MKKVIIDNIKWVLLFALIGSVLVRQSCKVNNSSHATTATYVTNFYDSSKHTNVVNKKYMNAKGDTIYEAIPAGIDSGKIAQLYYSRHAEESTTEDSSLKLTIHDTIGENRILYRNFTYKIKRPTRIETVVNNPPAPARRSISVGAFLLAGPNSFGFGPLIQYKPKTDKVFQGGFDMVTRSGYLGILTPIKLKR